MTQNLVRTLACLIIMLISAAAHAEQCCYYDCATPNIALVPAPTSPGATPSPYSQGRVTPVPTGPVAHEILIRCEPVRSCSASLERRPNCTPWAFKTNGVSCSDRETCPQGMHSGQDGERLLTSLLKEPGVTFVRASTFSLGNGRVIRIPPSPPH